MAQYIYTMNRVGKIVPPKREILKDISLSFYPAYKNLKRRGSLFAMGAPIYESLDSTKQPTEIDFKMADRMVRSLGNSQKIKYQGQPLVLCQTLNFGLEYKALALSSNAQS
ncbi:hypothetical protein PN36_12285 [Candidatus Thiomargarita nelsonii]|uniref:Uncharacterized protein n=1 Tax=Candidatus Thiomargarita nelsonii TaxID=1003181 RepID=A0A4E0R2R4_9GAMM|nr:hypothetical protein PN36_12285 [Candidatus Thiomargarita nelsonii]